VSYDSVAQVFGFDVTVQNLLVQRMGSDGFNVTGVKVFFASGPTATDGTGAIEVGNADGLDTFIGSLQPYFSYAGGLAPQAVTPARRWLLNVPKTVKTFSFTVYISTPVVPVIVAEMWPGGNRDIYRMGIDGNDVVKLSTSLSTDANPTVINGRVVFSSYRNGNADLYSVSLNGGTETRLTTATTNETLPALSPDGTQLAWVQAPTGGLTKVYRGDANAAGAVLATPGFADGIQTSPSWAPNGALAFTMANASSADIYGVAAAGDTAKLLTGSSSADVEPAYSVDGSKIAFASNRTGDTELYLYDVSTKAVTRLTTRSGSDGAPTWLSDGRIVFTCITGTTYHLCLIDPATPGTITTLATPYQADHAAAVRF
jgi:TolB protein